MTVASNDTISRAVIAGTGPYTFNFRIFDETELAVSVDTGGLDSTLLTISTDYEVAGVDDRDGGTVTLSADAAALYAGDTLDIRSNTVEQQPTSIRNQGSFLPEIHEDALDRLARQVQDLRRVVDSKLGYPDDGTTDGAMSSRSTWADKWVYVNADGEFEPASAINPQALTQSVIGVLLNPRTQGEIDALVFPTNYSRRAGDAVRYGFSAASTAAANVTAFNNALLSNQHVFLDDAGTYTINDSLVCRSNQTISLGQGVTIQSAASTPWLDTGIFEVVGVSNVTIRGGTLDGNKANNATGRCYGLRIFESSNVLVDGITCNNMPALNSLGVNGGDGIVVYGTGTSDIRIVNSVFDANVRQGISLAEVSRCTVANCIFTNTSGSDPGAGIDIEGDNPAHTLEHITITGCLFENSFSGVVVTSYSNYVTVVGNTFKGNRTRDIYVADTDHCTVSGNVCQAGSTVDGSPVLHVNGAEDVIISGNIVQGSGATTERQGILVEASSNVLVIGNLVKDTYRQGIQIGSTTMSASIDNITVSGNLVEDCVEASVATTAPILITGNSGSGFYPLRLVMTGNTIRDSRTAGQEADYAIDISTSIPAATQAVYRVSGNLSSGPAAVLPGGVNLPLWGSLSWNPASLSDGAGETSSAITVTGAAAGDSVDVYPPYDIQELLVTGAVSAANTVEIRIQNETGGTVDLGAGTWKVRVRKANE